MSIKIIPKKLKITTGADFEPLIFDLQENDGFSRSYNCRNRVVIMVWEEKEENNEAVAYIDLRISSYPGISMMEDIADENADSEESATTAIGYIKGVLDGNYDGDSEDFVDEDGTENEIAVCEMHTFYISPKYRGLGLSKRIMLMIPYILLFHLNLSDAVITAYVNPFKDQGCSADSDKVSSPQEYDLNCKNEELLTTMRKALLDIGFVDVFNDGRNYATEIRHLNEIVDKERLPYFWNWEFE